MSIEKKIDNSQQLTINLPEDVAQGTYSNLVIISHSSSEFILDFARILPGVSQAQVKSRIIITPEHTKRLLGALMDNISKYERINGEINIPSNSMPQVDFQGPIGDA